MTADLVRDIVEDFLPEAVSDGDWSVSQVKDQPVAVVRLQQKGILGQMGVHQRELEKLTTQDRRSLIATRWLGMVHAMMKTMGDRNRKQARDLITLTWIR